MANKKQQTSPKPAEKLENPAPVGAPPSLPTAQPSHQFFAQQMAQKKLPQELLKKFQEKTLTQKDIQQYYVSSLNKFNRWNKPT